MTALLVGAVVLLVLLLALTFRQRRAVRDLTPMQVVIGPVEDGVFEGRIVYDTEHEEIDDLDVRSTASWEHLEPHLG